MPVYSFSGFDWINYILLVAMAPVYALYCCRVLHPKYSYAKTCWLTAIFLALIVISTIANTKTEASIIWQVVIEVVAYFVLLRCLTKDSFSRVLFFFVIWMILQAFGDAAGNLVNGLLISTMGETYALDRLLNGNAYVLFVDIFQAALYILISDYVARRANRITGDVRWSMFALLLLTQFFAQIVIAARLTLDERSLKNVLLLCVYTLLCAVADIYIIRTFRSMVRNAELERQIALLDQQQSLERAQYEAVGAQMQSMRRLRHDYTNTLSTVGALLDMGETARIREILDTTTDQLAKTRIVRTGNATVDAVLYGKTADAAQKGISLSCALLWPESCAVSDTDLMRIFSNLLDNAIQYCETLPDGTQKRIEVASAIPQTPAKHLRK